MTRDDNISKLPSGLMAGKSHEEIKEMKETKKEETKGKLSALPEELESQGAQAATMSKLPLILGVIAILLSASALFVSLNGSKGLDANDRAALKDIASDLRAIQNKEITLSSPLRTTVFIEKTFPIADILPDSFDLPVTMDIPIDTTLTAQSNTGQIVPLHVNDNFKVNTSVPIDVAKTYENVKISINKEIPIETRFSATLKVSAVYGKELNDMIEKIDKLATGSK